MGVLYVIGKVCIFAAGAAGKAAGVEEDEANANGPLGRECGAEAKNSRNVFLLLEVAVSLRRHSLSHLWLAWRLTDYRLWPVTPMSQSSQQPICIPLQPYQESSAETPRCTGDLGLGFCSLLRCESATWPCCICQGTGLVMSTWSFCWVAFVPIDNWEAKPRDA